jgi:hypothetical protein
LVSGFLPGFENSDRVSQVAMNTPSPARRPTVAQVLLGLFVVWQLIFLGASNLLAFFPHAEPAEGELSDARNAPLPANDSGPWQSAIDLGLEATSRWAGYTGQIQAWWLFAPEFPNQATFPTVELRWDDPESSENTESLPKLVRLTSSLEPPDPQSYFRPWPSDDRLFHYEARLGLIMLPWHKELLEEEPELWREALQTRVQRQWRSMRAYLRWCVRRYQDDHPESPPPRQAVLLISIYRTPDPGQRPTTWGGPDVQPLARWLPEREGNHACLPIQAWNPLVNRFVDLSMAR